MMNVSGPCRNLSASAYGRPCARSLSLSCLEHLLKGLTRGFRVQGLGLGFSAFRV